MKVKHYILGLSCALLTSGCVSEFDMQGHNANDYYAQHPVKNDVETRYMTRLLHLTPKHGLSTDQEEDLAQQVHQISPLAIDNIELQLHPSHAQEDGLRERLTTMLIRMGVPRERIAVVSMEEVARHDVSVQISYASLVSPRCPDWRTSAITSYSNMVFTPNIGCANVTNLGLMVADPRDLEEGEGEGTPDTNSTVRAIKNYRSGESSSDDSGGSTGTEGVAGLGQ